MEINKFYEDIVNGKKETIKLDKEVQIYQYLPYLENISKDIVDNYNKFILRRRYGYYNDMNLPHYIIEKNQYTSDFEILNNLKNLYDELTELLNTITIEFNNAFLKSDYYSRAKYVTYQRICLTNLTNEINRINEVIYKIEPKIKNKYKIIKTNNINNLILYFLLLLFLFLIFYNIFN